MFIQRSSPSSAQLATTIVKLEFAFWVIGCVQKDVPINIPSRSLARLPALLLVVFLRHPRATNRGDTVMQCLSSTEKFRLHTESTGVATLLARFPRRIQRHTTGRRLLVPG